MVSTDGQAGVWDFDAIGTSWRIETRAPLDDAARAEVSALIERFDREWSRFRADSLIAALAHHGGSIPAPPDAATMLDAYVELATATAGAVNPLVGATLERRGYDGAYTFIDHGATAAPDDWRERLTWHEGILALTGPAVIDVGAVGKGHLVDLVLGVVRDRIAGDVLVDASGDLAVRGAPVRIALEHPYDARRAIGVVELADEALCASATNRRVWGDGLHHVLDARTGEPVRTVVATWAVAPDALHADAVATALFFDGGPELAHAWGVQWVRMTTDGRVEWSPDSKAELFT